jgi:hypothetical protein
MSPEIQETTSPKTIPMLTMEELINNIFGEQPAPPEPPKEDHSPRMRNRVREIRSAQAERLKEGQVATCSVHPFLGYPTNEQCIGCVLNLGQYTFQAILEGKKEKTGPGGKNANDPEKIYSETRLTALKAAINAQNERMYSMDTMPSYCATHDWYHSEGEMCIHCQMMLPPIWWQGKIGKPEYPGTKADSAFLKYDSNKHLFLNKHYSIMPRGTILTIEEIVEKIPAIIEVAPNHIKTSIKEVLIALSRDAKTLPSHIYHDPNSDQVKVVWFDPLGEMHFAVAMYSTSDKSPAWEKSTAHPWRITHDGMIKSAATATEGIGIVEEILITRRGADPTPVVESEIDEYDDDDDEEEEDEDEYHPEYDEKHVF